MPSLGAGAITFVSVAKASPSKPQRPSIRLRSKGKILRISSVIASSTQLKSKKQSPLASKSVFSAMSAARLG